MAVTGIREGETLYHISAPQHSSPDLERPDWGGVGTEFAEESSAPLELPLGLNLVGSILNAVSKSMNHRDSSPTILLAQLVVLDLSITPASTIPGQTPSYGRIHEVSYHNTHHETKRRRSMR